MASQEEILFRTTLADLVNTCKRIGGDCDKCKLYNACALAGCDKKPKLWRKAFLAHKERISNDVER